MARKPTARKAAKRPARGGTAADPAKKIIDATLGLVVERGWRNVSLADIAAASGTPLADLYREFPAKTAVLEGFVRRVDAAVLAGVGPVVDTEYEEESPRNRLFDILMRRFDALAPHKDAVAALIEGLPRDPLAAAVMAAQELRSFAWMLEAAGVPASGLRGASRVKLLLGAWLATVRVWLNDDDPDLGRTMAALDRNLRRAGRWSRGVSGQRVSGMRR